MTTKQNRIGYSLTMHQQRIDTLLRTAFLAMKARLKRVPAEASSWWYNAGREDNPVHAKGRDAVVAGQLAMQAALETQDPTVIEETAEAIANYFDEMKAAALVDYLARSGGSLPTALAEVSREVSEAQYAVTLLALHPTCRATAERTAREVREARDECVRALPQIERIYVASPSPRKHAASAR